MKKIKVEIKMTFWALMEVEADNEDSAKEQALEKLDLREIGGDSECSAYVGVRGQENSFYISTDSIEIVEINKN